MINLFFLIFRIRFLLTVGAIYLLLSASTHAHFSIKLPSFSQMSVDNLNSAIMALFQSDSKKETSSKQKESNDTALLSTVKKFLDSNS